MILKSVARIGFITLACAGPLSAQQAQAPPAPGAAPPEVGKPVDAAFVPQVESKTEALELLDVARRHLSVRIRVKNASGKNIYAFRVSYHRSGASTLFCFINNDDKTALAPGEVYEFDHPFLPQSPLARQPLAFEAVLFEDGTGDGEAKKVKGLQDLFLASRKELEHVITLLQAAVESPEVEAADSLSELEVSLSGTPDYTRGVATEGLGGLMLQAWKETAMRVISDLKTRRLGGADVNVREELEKLNGNFNRALAKYPGAA